MKRFFGIALLALPLAAGAVHADGWPFNIQAGGSFYIKGGPGPASPLAGPWYLYWPLEAHFVAPAPTGYPYWPSPQGLPATTIGGPACPPGVPVVAAPAVAAPPVMPAPGAAVPPPVSTTPAPVTPAPRTPPQTSPTSAPQLQLPPYLQPTSYYPTGSPGQAPSYWYDR
jgi:hypothetical protein